MPLSVSPGWTLYPPSGSGAPVCAAGAAGAAAAVVSPVAGIWIVLPSTTFESGESPFAAATELVVMLFAAAIDHSVSPGWTVCGTDALAGAQGAMAASAPSAPMRVGFRTSSCLRVVLAPTRSGKGFDAPSRRAQLWPP